MRDVTALPTPTLDALFDEALAVREHAYAPYSGFAVGAALITDAGLVFTGANVENAAYPLGLCAEAAAIGAMASAGGRRIVAIMVVGDGETLVTPCGGCRQRIAEFADPQTMVHVGGLRGVRASFRLAELLPAAFGPANLA